MPSFLQGRAAAGLELPAVEMLTLEQLDQQQQQGKKKQEAEEKEEEEVSTMGESSASKRGWQEGEEQQAAAEEEERWATLCWVVQGLHPELCVELVKGLGRFVGEAEDQGDGEEGQEAADSSEGEDDQEDGEEGEDTVDGSEGEDD